MTLQKLRRSQLEIIIDLLSAMQEPIPRTALMTKTGITWYQLNKYLTMLEDKQLIQYQKVETLLSSTTLLVFVTTEKGRQLLKQLLS